MLSNSGGTSEYRVTQTFVNNAGVPWTGFVFELGFGTGAGFVRSTSTDGLDFDAPAFDPAPASPVFPAAAVQADVLKWSGALVNSVGVASFAFAVDVPDNLQAFNPQELNRFTLRQIPVSPPVALQEPATACLLGLMLAGLGLAANARRQMLWGGANA